MGVRTNYSWKLQADMELIGMSNMDSNPVPWSARGIGCPAALSNIDQRTVFKKVATGLMSEG